MESVMRDALEQIAHLTDGQEGRRADTMMMHGFSPVKALGEARDLARNALERVAGVEPLATSSLPGDPPAHERPAGGPGLISGGRDSGPRVAPTGVRETTPSGGVPRLAVDETRQGGRLHTRYPDPATPSDEFGRHFFRCFFCRIGDRYVTDYFCETGRELMVAMLDELHDREFA